MLVAIMAVVFVTTMIVAKPDLGELFSGLVPSLNRNNTIVVISMVGTTVVPYNFFIHAGSAKQSWNKPEQLELSKWDTAVSITIGGLITAAILITSGTLIRGMTIQNAADISIQLEPLLGSWAKVFMSVGLFSAGLSSAIATPLGASYTLAGLFGWKYSNEDSRFRMTNIIVVLIGIVVSAIGFNPMTILLVAQALNGIILPIVAIYVVYIASSKKILGEYRNTTLQKVLGWIVALVTVILGTYALVSAIQGFF